MNEPNRQSRNLDLLRAAAVSLVFGSHLILSQIHGLYVPVQGQPQEFWKAQLFDLGRIGVLLFFVHTALVLLQSMDRSGQGVIAFYIRRFFRIYPLSIACILIVLLLRVPFTPESTFAWPSGRDLLANLLLIQNLTFSKDIISPLWTLPREVQMYLLLPPIYLILRRFGSAPLVLVMWCGFFAAVPHAQALSCVPSFFGGVLGYQLIKEKTFRFPALFWPIGLSTLVLLHLWFRQNIIDDYRLDYILCMFVGCLVPNFRDIAGGPLAKACHIVAKYSYGIYLFHFIAIWLAFVKFAWLPLGLQWAALCILMAALPWIAYHSLEAPLIEVGKHLAARWSGSRKPAIRPALEGADA